MHYCILCSVIPAGSACQEILLIDMFFRVGNNIILFHVPHLDDGPLLTRETAIGSEEQSRLKQEAYKEPPEHAAVRILFGWLRTRMPCRNQLRPSILSVHSRSIEGLISTFDLKPAIYLVKKCC
jgi:hypothetical protein